MSAGSITPPLTTSPMGAAGTGVGLTRTDRPFDNGHLPIHAFEMGGTYYLDGLDGRGTAELQTAPHFIKFTTPYSSTPAEDAVSYNLRNYILTKRTPSKFSGSKSKQWHQQKLIAAQVLFYTLQIEDPTQRRLALTYMMSPLSELGDGFVEAACDGKLKALFDRAMDTVSEMNPKAKRYFGQALYARYARTGHRKDSPAITNMPGTSAEESTTARLLSRIPLSGEFEKLQKTADGQVVRCVMAVLKPSELSGLHKLGIMPRTLQLSDWEDYWDANPATFTPDQRTKLERLVTELRDALTASEGGFVALRDGGLYINVVETDCGEDYTPEHMAVKLKLLEVYEYMLSIGVASVIHCKSGVGRSFETFLASQVLSILKGRPDFNPTQANYYKAVQEAYEKVKAKRGAVVAGKEAHETFTEPDSGTEIQMQKRLRNVCRTVMDYVAAHGADFPEGLAERTIAASITASVAASGGDRKSVV